MKLSPWFKLHESPEREGLYQVKYYNGDIKFLDWKDGRGFPIPDVFLKEWRGICG